MNCYFMTLTYFIIQCPLFSYHRCVFALYSSQSLSTLTVIEEFLAKRPMPAGVTPPDTQRQTWVRNLNYYSESSNPCPLSSLSSKPATLQECGHLH